MKAQSNAEEGHSSFWQEMFGNTMDGRTAEEQLKHSLFGDDDDGKMFEGHLVVLVVLISSEINSNQINLL